MASSEMASSKIAYSRIPPSQVASRGSCSYPVHYNCEFSTDDQEAINSTLRKLRDALDMKDENSWASIETPRPGCDLTNCSAYISEILAFINSIITPVKLNRNERPEIIIELNKLIELERDFYDKASFSQTDGYIHIKCRQAELALKRCKRELVALEKEFAYLLGPVDPRSEYKFLEPITRFRFFSFLLKMEGEEVTEEMKKYFESEKKKNGTLDTLESVLYNKKRKQVVDTIRTFVDVIYRNGFLIPCPDCPNCSLTGIPRPTVQTGIRNRVRRFFRASESTSRSSLQK